MQNIVIDKPYRFVPPHHGSGWTWLIQRYLPRYLNRTFGIAAYEIRGGEHLNRSLAAGHGVLLAPNHCRPCDPMVMGLLTRVCGRHLFCMASWHLFMQGRFQHWLIRRCGAFSVYREGLDRESMKTAIDIIVQARRPLLVFAEGMVSRSNDWLGPLMEGPSFLARSAAKQRAKAAPPGNVVIHPVALKYFFHGDLPAAVGPVLDAIETRMSWRPQRERSLVERITKLGEALLCLKEIEYHGGPQAGPMTDRLAALIEHILVPLEKEWVNGQRDEFPMARVRRLRSAIVPDMAAGGLSEEERARRWRHLADLYLVQQLACYPPDYVQTRPTRERILETVERFEEDLTDVARIHRPLRVVIQVDEAIEVPLGRERGGPDPIMLKLEERLRALLDQLSREPTDLYPPPMPSREPAHDSVT